MEQLEDEIGFLKKTWRTKQRLRSLRDNKYVLKSVGKKTAFEHPSQKLTLLLDWVNAVCAFYGLKVGHLSPKFLIVVAGHLSLAARRCLFLKEHCL